jgi:integrase
MTSTTSPNPYRLSISGLCAETETTLRARHYSPRTTKSYVYWIQKFLKEYWFCKPDDLGEREVTAFLTGLALRDKVAAATQNQALSAILFLFKQVLGRELGWMEGIVRARRSQHLPVVLSRNETQAVLAELQGVQLLVAELLYGSGLRLSECLRMRVKDIDFDQLKIDVRDGKGKKDRGTVLPARVIPRLQHHLEKVHRLHAKGLLEGGGFVELPHALARKYPNAATSWRHRPASGAAIMCTRRSSKRRSTAPSAPPASRNPPAATPSGTALPRTC